ncbi:MAG: hypothetical protein CO001_01245 [Candidatus Portnoybacteria bacterium CG_4_8_14_3_um_filter_40_10]|uniref:Transcriptional repressor PaaX-like central Cas2-like domain-containing protein n=2 Tax=Candidatus Portnoyibacteriota TaxID=1817913 RepID=A0A2M7IIW9_9BACT|nr:MAG: hypothetical protein COV84_02120 [Candidatus Portnoybacteria bacterium CG11_big_fil_rev_8_21_14_0_20_40_15]PIS31398.1 MAG: hypothetical protein COT41_01950 [Candidatus Portnoybacteria bacterium CG08_land_8_20_14_0_20_40_83]PIW76464.1 MAG: hypothetical protein CO001_01245 [Candidatus Portnoybacteria bacterium CG_4_8_14_3_um_filter_40_10]
MKSEKRIKILEFIERTAKTLDDIFFIFCQPYGTSYSKMEYSLERKHARESKETSNKLIDRQTKRRFDDFVYRLKKDDLICNIERKNKKIFQLTSKGKMILKEFRSDKTKLPARSKYKNEEDETLKIIIFDIPEEERRKRDWLRCALKNLKFGMLQKSVWAGKRGLPQEFIDDLKRMNIFSFVEIFAVSKTGSLIQFKN